MLNILIILQKHYIKYKGKQKPWFMKSLMKSSWKDPQKGKKEKKWVCTKDSDPELM